MPNPPLAVWIPILMNVVALLQCVLAATSFAEATAVKKNANGAKELGGVYTLYTARNPERSSSSTKLATTRKKFGKISLSNAQGPCAGLEER